MSMPLVTDLTQDVRLAVAMAGGVSLAVWMGGVSREINLLQQASDSRPRGGGPGSRRAPAERDWDARARALYRNLLELLDVTVTVDVLSGTSAGGINAALLGMSSAGGADLAGLRDLWLRSGALDVLLRDPAEKSPPSLMQGDRVLYEDLARGINDVHRTCRRVGDNARPTTVYVTTTMMTGETSRFTDGYGTLVPDVDHHGLLTFDERALAPSRLLNDEQSLTALALAARSSAAFPGAFEPSFIPVGESVEETEPGIPGRPDMRDYANMTRSHWATDGGILANRPLSPVLSTVFAAPADREVRRILAFVAPDGGGTASPAADVLPDAWGRPYTLAEALRADLGAQLSQSIASDLRAIQSHNERVQSGHDLRRTLAEFGTRLDPQRLLTPAMMDDYKRQQGGALARPLLDGMMRELTNVKLPDPWKRQLSPSREADLPPIEQHLAAVMTGRFTRTWAYTPAARDGAAVFADAARLGHPALDAAQAITVQLVRYGYQLATDEGQRKNLAKHRRAIRDAVIPAVSFNDRQAARDLVRAAAEAYPVSSLEQVATQLADAKWEALSGGGTSAAGVAWSLGDQWRRLEQAAASLIATLRPLAAQAAGQRRNRTHAADAVKTYLAYFTMPGTTAGAIASRLLDLAIAERALEPADAGVDQPVELVQVSANTRTQLSDQDTVSKLRGVGLHHFAAFYKSSWRAYDWMWGRLDGCGWLVHILLDPRRILAVCEDHPDVYGAPHERPEKFLDALLEAAGMREVDHACRADLLKSLQFLSDPTAVIPVGLPDFALFIAQAGQKLITANELPIVAREMLIDDGHLPEPEGRRKPWRARRRPTRMPDEWAITVHEMNERASCEESARLLSSCPIRGETLGKEARTPAFAQTVTKAIAVAAAAVAAAPEAPAQVKPILASARTVTRTSYLITQATGGKARVLLFLGLAAVVIGGVLATQGMMLIGVTGTAIAIAGLYLIIVSAWGINRRLPGALAGITVLAALASLTLSWVRRFLWGKGEQKDTTGWVPAHALPWLNSTWWGGLAVLGGLLALAIITGIAWRNRSARNS